MSLTSDGHTGSTRGRGGRFGRNATALGDFRCRTAGLLGCFLLGLLHLRVCIGDAVERILLGTIAKEVLLKCLEFFLDAALLLGEGSGVVVAHLCQGLAQHVGGLVNLALITVEREEIVHAHRGGIVQIAGHDRLTAEEGFQIGILHPEQGIFGGLATEIILPHHHWTQGQHLAAEGGVGLVEIG